MVKFKLQILNQHYTHVLKNWQANFEKKNSGGLVVGLKAVICMLNAPSDFIEDFKSVSALNLHSDNVTKPHSSTLALKNSGIPGTTKLLFNNLIGGNFESWMNQHFFHERGATIDEWKTTFLTTKH